MADLEKEQNLFSGDDEATWRRRWKMMFASVAGYAMDGLDMLILSFAMTAILKEFGWRRFGWVYFRHYGGLHWPGKSICTYYRHIFDFYWSVRHG